ERARGAVRARRLPRLAVRVPALRLPSRRRAAIILFTIGALLLVEVALTALWKEPFTAYLASGAQSDLGKQLDKLARRPLPPGPDPNARMAAAATQLRAQTHVGGALGRLRVPRIGIDFVAVQGTGGPALRKGPGHYLDSFLPGQGGLVGIAGHRTTY